MTKVRKICIFGDSKAWGAWDLEKGGWVNRLWLQVAKNTANCMRIYNLGISNGTTETILTCFENEAKTRKADAVVFQTGGNDAGYKSESNNYLIQPEKFRENIKEIIKRTKKIANNIAFVSLINCDESKTMPVSWIDIYYTNENVKKYNQILKEVCQDKKVHFIDVEMLNNNDFDEDGLHPNSAGHNKIFETVKDFMIKNEWI